MCVVETTAAYTCAGMYSYRYLLTCNRVPVPVALLVEEAHEEGRRLPVRRVAVWWAIEWAVGMYMCVGWTDLGIENSQTYLHPQKAPQLLHRAQRVEPEEGGPAALVAAARGGVCSGGGGGGVVEAGHHHGAGEAAVLCRWGWGSWRWVGLVFGDGPVGGWVDEHIFMNTPIRHETIYIYLHTSRKRLRHMCASALVRTGRRRRFPSRATSAWCVVSLCSCERVCMCLGRASHTTPPRHYITTHLQTADRPSESRRAPQRSRAGRRWPASGGAPRWGACRGPVVVCCV